MRVKALEPITYGVPPVDYKTGDEFDTVEDMHATILSHAQKVMIVQAATDTEPGPTQSDNRRSGRYNRRDMRAKR